MHILIAPNAFKNSLDAVDVAAAIDEGLKQSAVNCTTTCFPVGDGGDGTGSLIIRHLRGKIFSADVSDPLGKKIKSSFGIIDDGKTAVIEMADASGLRLLDPNALDPLTASSFGTGELIKHALDRDVTTIILCIGGSATVDGGVGILQALGFRFINEKQNPIDKIPDQLSTLAGIDNSAVDKRIAKLKLIILCDVENPLLGNEGAAAVFGPQKGASMEDVKKLENSLSKLRDVILQQTGKDISKIEHGGAAGGVAAGLSAMLNAKLVNGIDYFLSITGFERELEKADIVITGEGSIDQQTLQGKGPFGVAKRAKKKNIPVIGLAGNTPSKPNAELQKYFDILQSINPAATSLADAIKHTRENLIATAKRIINNY